MIDRNDQTVEPRASFPSGNHATTAAPGGTIYMVSTPPRPLGAGSRPDSVPVSATLPAFLGSQTGNTVERLATSLPEAAPFPHMRGDAA